MNVIALLKDLGYLPLIQPERVLADSIRYALGKLGKPVSKALLHSICLLHNLSEDELLMNFELVAKSLKDMLGDGADIILFMAKERMYQHIADKNPNLTIGEIMNTIRKEETMKFVRDMQGHEHILLLYSCDDSRDRILSEFFTRSKAPKGVIASKPTMHKNVSNILYEELLKDRTNAMEKLSGWIHDLHSADESSVSARIADEDCMWYFEHDLGNERMIFEESLTRNAREEMVSVICSYNISKLSHEQLKSIIGLHDIVIIDEPYMVYKQSYSRIPLKILLAEDEYDIAKSYKIALEARSHYVVTTRDGEECLKVYNDELERVGKNENPFDVIVIDYRMPKRNGLEIAKEIFTMRPKQRIIFASAYVKDTLLDSLKELDQIIELLQKPFELSALIDTIEDKEIYPELVNLNSQVQKLKEKGQPSDEDVANLLASLSKVQRGRTF